MSGRFLWRGRSTGARYEYDRSQIPAALLDGNGVPMDGTYNGELCIVANEDMSVAPSVKTGPPPGAHDIWSAYVLFSDWDSHRG